MVERAGQGARGGGGEGQAEGVVAFPRGGVPAYPMVLSWPTEGKEGLLREHGPCAASTFRIVKEVKERLLRKHGQLGICDGSGF